MTHRRKVDAIPLGADREQLLARVAAIRHSRLLVYRDSLDDLAGVLHVHDLFAVLQRPPGSFDLQGLLRPVLTVPESLAADDLLERMQAEGRQLAVVIDEYGSTAGIVTIQDLVEALVGPIQDEPALGGADTSAAGGGRAADGSLLLEGLTDLAEFQERTGLPVDPADHHLAKTLGGWSWPASAASLPPGTRSASMGAPYGWRPWTAGAWPPCGCCPQPQTTTDDPCAQVARWVLLLPRPQGSLDPSADATPGDRSASGFRTPDRSRCDP